jgi:hypothetical protein
MVMQSSKIGRSLDGYRQFRYGSPMQGLLSGRRIRVPLLASVGVALVASACTSSDAAPEVASTPQATAYLATVKAAETDFAAAFQELWTATNRSYATRSVLFAAASEADFAAAATVALDTARSSAPPDGYSSDHDAWVRFRIEAGLLAQDLPVALKNEDMQEMMGVFTGLEQALGVMLRDTSRTFCLAASFDMKLCRAPEDLPGGDYGRQVHEVLRLGTLSRFGLFTFPVALSEEERAVRLGEVQPAIEASLAQSRDEFQAIEAPSEFQEDHDAFVRFFTDQHLTAVAITEANAERDTAAVLALFDQSGVNAGQLEHALSPPFEKIAAPHFAHDFTN